MKYVIDSMGTAHRAGNCEVLVGEIVGGVEKVTDYTGKQMFVICADCED